MSEPKTPLTLSIPEAGWRYYGLKPRASYNAAANGDLPTIPVNGRRRVPVVAMEAKLAKVAEKASA